MRTLRSRVGALALAVAVVALPVGCSDDATTTGATSSTTASTARPPASTATLVLYYAYDRGGMVPVRRDAPAPIDPEDAVRALAEPPGDPTLAPALPPGTMVRGVTVADGVAVVDLSGEYETGYPSGGSAAELAVVAPLVYTLTGLGRAGIQAVRITVEGRTPEPVGAQLDLSRPLTRDDVPTPIAHVTP